MMRPEPICVGHLSGAPSTSLRGMVYLVVNEESGLVGVFLDNEPAAIECAQARQGVVVHLNIDGDYRPAT